MIDERGDPAEIREAARIYWKSKNNKMSRVLFYPH